MTVSKTCLSLQMPAILDTYLTTAQAICGLQRTTEVIKVFSLQVQSGAHLKDPPLRTAVVFANASTFVLQRRHLVCVRGLGCDAFCKRECFLTATGGWLREGGGETWAAAEAMVLPWVVCNDLVGRLGFLALPLVHQQPGSNCQTHPSTHFSFFAPKSQAHSSK